MVAAAVLRWVWLFLPLTLTHASSGSFSVEVPGAPLSGLFGGSMTLPCTVSNSLDVRQLEVRWHRPLMFSTPVLLYKNGKYEEGSAEKQFQGRASLLGGLEKGDVSLKLDKLRLTDEGKYICHVSSDNWYDSKNTSLKIQAVGSTPILSVADAGGGEVNVSCHSTRWLPKPSLTWRDKEGRDLNSFSTDRFTKDSEGFTTVSSWLLIPASESEWISCSLSLSAFNQELRESRVLPHTPTESWKGAFIWTLILLLLFIGGVGVYFVLNRRGLIGSKKKKKEDTEIAESQPLNSSVEKQQQHDDPSADTPYQSPEFTGTDPLKPPPLDKDQQEQNNPQTALAAHQTASTEWEQMRKCKVNISIDPAETPHFFSVTNQGKTVCCPCIDEDYDEHKIFTVCKEKFSSGKHYWEVKLIERNQGKRSWYVGVASDTAERMYRIPLTTVNEFWVLCYEEERGVHIIDAVAPVKLNTVRKKIQTLGVYLDCDQHTVSFYDADRESLIYTFTNLNPRKSLQPLISPGIMDSIPITIC